MLTEYSIEIVCLFISNQFFQLLISFKKTAFRKSYLPGRFSSTSNYTNPFPVCEPVVRIHPSYL